MCFVQAQQVLSCVDAWHLLDLLSEIEIVPADDAVFDEAIVLAFAISCSSFSVWVYSRGYRARLVRLIHKAGKARKAAIKTHSWGMINLIDGFGSFPVGAD